MKKFLTIKQAIRGAEDSGLPISRRTLDRYVEKGELRAIKLDGKIVFDESEFERFLKARTTAPTYKPKPKKKPKAKLPDFLKPGWKPPQLPDYLNLKPAKSPLEYDEAELVRLTAVNSPLLRRKEK